MSHYSKLFYTIKSSVLVPYVTIPYLYLLYHITTKVSTLSKSTIYVYTVYIYSRPFPAFKRNNFSPYWMKANISLLYAESRRMAEHPSLGFFYTLTQFYPTIGGIMCIAQRWESYTVYDICVGWKVRKGTVIYL